jgi:chaperonin GroES
MMKVMGNRVLVKKLDEPELKSKYIEVISHEKEPGHFALVAGVGPGFHLPSGVVIPIEVHEGDLVILKKYSGAPVSLKGADDNYEEFHLVDAEDVLAVVDKPKPIPVVVS